MLWRKGYNTFINPHYLPPHDPPCPVLIGISDPQQLPDAEIWFRLLEKQFPALNWAILAINADLDGLLSPSRLMRVIPTTTNWQQSREFALCHSLLMVGPPTEEAWEQFADAVAKSR
jgi:hypothetical protein